MSGVRNPVSKKKQTGVPVCFGFLQSAILTPLADGVDHGQIALCRHIIRDGIPGAEGDSAVALHLLQTIQYVIPDIVRRKAAEHIRINASEVSDPVAVPANPFAEMRDAVLVGMLCVNFCAVDDIIEYREQIAACLLYTSRAHET